MASRDGLQALREASEETDEEVSSRDVEAAMWRVCARLDDHTYPQPSRSLQANLAIEHAATFEAAMDHLSETQVVNHDGDGWFLTTDEWARIILQTAQPIW